MNTAANGRPALSLSRTLDPSFPSNRLAAGGIAAGVLLGRLRGQSWAGSLRTGLGSFAAWATARELDPDHAGSATLAQATELLLGLLADEPADDLSALEELAAAFVVLSSLRVLSATVGVAPTRPEQALLAAGALCAGLTGQKAAALVPGASLLLGHPREDDLGPADPWGGVAALAAALLPAWLEASERDSGPSRLAAAAALATAPAFVRIENVEARNDLDTAEISHERVKSSRLLSAGALALGLITGGTRGLRPLAAACAGVGLWALARARQK
ncbi:hypothetical protein [Deinococcus sp. Marseille-Q6407]|uniref:hypothetical protein n=1 Tax=Deinococcus sp. Marseille-Q6407 TaxID=2969223 RepID=UPI0021C1DDDB|nr:hypothetical protein [Deinococcus sp. Marseille-Q6407]